VTGQRAPVNVPDLMTSVTATGADGMLNIVMMQLSEFAKLINNN